MKYRKTIKLDVSGHGKMKKVFAKQLDAESRYLDICLTANGEALAIPSDAAARLRAIKPDGASVLNDCEIAGDRITVELTEQILAMPGIVRADIGIYAGTALLSTAQFLIQVQRSTVDSETVESSYEYNALTNALGAVSTSVTDAKAAAESAATAVAAAEVLETQMTAATKSCQDATTAAADAASLAEGKATLADTAAQEAQAAAQTAQTAARRAETAADGCDAFINQEIGDVVDAAIGAKVDAKVEESVSGLVGSPNGVAGLDANGKITPMPTASEVGAAAVSHTHGLDDLTGTVAITQGGTGATTAEGALTNLGAASATHAHSLDDLTGTVAITQGGTGAATAEEALTNLGAASAIHAHSLDDLTGTVAITQGGTGAATAEEALTNLGAASESHEHSTSHITTGTLPIARGGTGATSVPLARYVLGLGNTNGPVPVANGGTGGNTAAKARTNLGVAAAEHTHTMADIVDAVSTAAFCLERGEAESTWQQLSLSGSVLAGDAAYQVVNGQVWLAGGVEVTAAAGIILLADLPEELRPMETITKLAAADGMRLVQLMVTTDGQLACSWVYDLVSNTALTDGKVTGLRLEMTYRISE